MEGTLVTRVATTAAIARNDLRRARILAALRTCMKESGYASTSLSDIARAASMTPSHLLYYFKGKDAILFAYWDNRASELLATLRVMESEPLERRLDLMTEAMLSDEGDLGLFLEFCGLSVRHKELYQVKARFDREFKAWLAIQLQDSPRKLGPFTQLAAESAYAQLMGLCMSAYFDETFSFDQARALLRFTLRQLCGYEPPLEIRQ